MATLIKQVQSFVTNQRNAGANGLLLVKTCIDHMFEHNDWTPLAWLLAKTEQRDATVLAAIVGAVTDGVTKEGKSKEAKAQPSGICIIKKKDARINNKYAILCDLVEEKVSFRSADVKARLLEREPPTFDAEMFVKRLLAKLEKEHLTLDQVLKIAAKQSKVNAEPVVAKTARKEVKAVAA